MKTQKVKLGEKFQDLKIKAAVGHAAGKQLGAQLALKNYDHYRRWSSILWVLFMLFFLMIGMNSMALICFGILHLHILFNQLWWKLVNFEHNYLKPGIFSKPKDEEDGQ